MKVFVTGASGYLGQRLSMRLANAGHEVHAYIRNRHAAVHLQHENIEIFFGDLTETEKMQAALKDCEQVYHTAALARVWVKDKKDYYRVNVEGTDSILKEANKAGVRKIVFTSSAGVIGPSMGKPMSEYDPRITTFSNDYELSKHLAEKSVISASTNGLQCVIVRPSRIYGPGIESPASGVNNFIKGYLKKKFALIPATDHVHSNYCFIDDVVDGHVKAMHSGKNGEIYTLGGSNISYHDFFAYVRQYAPVKGTMIKIPFGILMAWSISEVLKYRLSGKGPKITPRLLRTLLENKLLDCSKAVTELDYRITPFEKGLQETIQFIINHSK